MLKLVFQILLSLASIQISMAGDDDEEGVPTVPRSPQIASSSEVTSYTFRVNETLPELTCVISQGSPTPTVLWIKDSKKIKTDQNFEVNYDPPFSQTTLRFLNRGSPGLSGHYICSASNFLGRAVKGFILIHNSTTT